MNILSSAKIGVVLLTCALPTGLLQGSDISAFIEPYYDIDVALSEMGTLAYLHVQEGDRVTQGQVLGGLDEEVLQAALIVAQQAKDSRGRLLSAEAELAFQRENLLKIRQLTERRHASEEELARAENQTRIAEAQVLAIREELELKSAEYARTEAMLRQKQIRSPINGIVTRVYKDMGEFVSASDPVVMKIVNLDALRVEFPIPARAARAFEAGQRVPLRIGGAHLETEGKVEFVSPITDPQSNTVRLKIRIENPKGRFRSGDSCHIEVAPAETSSQSSYFTKAKTTWMGKP